ncbi:YheC/YheD family protein [Bacillus sp. FJAT-42376]|uniref:YheC/YheD family endospore coat-associated protein n=1 Tax=Bacillus sp. FJAT-42376 TaxID=2014076 RepID=UPI000F4E5A9C|nr:YheC/YheD family protein [Bacillus sp. FJAT-42376]AZB42194.1 YheC/YheD family protein [Bacillus sp. FJAT-42376]
MKWKKTDLFLHDDPNPSVKISSGLLEQFREFSNSRWCVLSIGRNSVKVRLVIINDKSSFLSLSKSAALSASIPERLIGGQTLQIRMEADRISLGPVFAILTDSRAAENHISLGNMEDYFTELASYCAERGYLFYLFALKDWKEGNVSGWVRQDEQWVRTVMPYPDVIHNRLHQRKTELGFPFISFTKELVRLGIPFFNHRFLNKWEVYEWLESDPVLLPYVPASKKLASKKDFDLYTATYADFFIKPIYGSQGKKIFRVRETDDGYLLDDTSSIEPASRFKETDELFRHMYPRLTKEPYMLQETIRIITYHSKPLDFRILCHKKNEQVWGVTSMTARVSSDSTFVSNLYQGGTAYPVKKILTELYGDKKARSIRNMLAELSEEICLAVERNTDGCYGEFGIDLTLDEDERLWLIEINSKPSKNSEYVSGLVKVRPSAKAVADFGMHLSNRNEVEKK